MKKRKTFLLVCCFIFDYATCNLMNQQKNESNENLLTIVIIARRKNI